MTAAWALLIIVLILLSASVVLIAFGVFRALSNATIALDRAHERWVQQVDKLTDKILTHSWEQYTSVRVSQEEDTGGFYTQEEQNEAPTEILRPKVMWGSLSADEEVLLSEDFTADGDPITSGAERDS